MAQDLFDSLARVGPSDVEHVYSHAAVVTLRLRILKVPLLAIYLGQPDNGQLLLHAQPFTSSGALWRRICATRLLESVRGINQSMNTRNRT